MGIVSSGLLYLITVERHVYFDDDAPMYWRYLIVIFFLIIAFAFLINAEIESVEISKELKLLVVEKKNLFCRHNIQSRDLE